MFIDRFGAFHTLSVKFSVQKLAVISNIGPQDVPTVLKKMRSDGSDYASTDNYELTATFTGPRSTTTSPELITLSALIGVNSMQETHLLLRITHKFLNHVISIHDILLDSVGFRTLSWSPNTL